jgi:carbamoyl-phosphate synthase small subunit
MTLPTNTFKPAKLALANGRIFEGLAPAWQSTNVFGEVVFNTGMTGYEETLTDPSYSGQILTFTYPILGNYGVADGTNFESKKIHTQGIICQTLFDNPSHHKQTQTFLDWLEKEQTPIITGIDTRELTKVIREHGVINGALVFNNKIPKKFGDAMATDWVKAVSRTEVETYGSGKYKIILVDCGTKQNIIRNLLQFDITLKVVPYNYDYSAEDFDGVFLSNGPGDPKLCKDTIKIVDLAMRQAKPVYGICLGSQLMGLAIGANTYKLKFGHRGQNQPCIELSSNKCYLTSQNHGYAVDEETIPEDWEVSFRHLNDKTVSGIAHKFLPFSAVQFHPESAPGPHDTFYFFEQFIDCVIKIKDRHASARDDMLLCDQI